MRPSVSFLASISSSLGQRIGLREWGTPSDTWITMIVLTVVIVVVVMVVVVIAVAMILEKMVVMLVVMVVVNCIAKQSCQPLHSIPNECKQGVKSDCCFFFYFFSPICQVFPLP